VFSYYVLWQRGTAHICLQLLQQSIDISGLLGPQQQTYYCSLTIIIVVNNTHTHTRLTALCPGLSGWPGTRKVKPIWILLKQETASGSGISWTMCKCAPRARQITMQHPPLSFLQVGCRSCHQPTASKHWSPHVIRHCITLTREATNSWSE